MENTYNFVQLYGTAKEEPILSHETHGRKFYRFPLKVERLSGQEDILPILLPEAIGVGLQTIQGQKLMVEGQLRSFNNKSGEGPRLVLSVYARVILSAEGPDDNRVELQGVLCKPPVLRRTPLGRYICDIMLAVNRRYGRADYLPCIAWGQLAVKAASMEVGDSLHLTGRAQSRTYTKVIAGEAQDRVAYEISIMELLPLR